MIFVLFYKQHRGQPEIMGRLLTKRIFYCLRNLTNIPALALIELNVQQFCSYIKIIGFACHFLRSDPYTFQTHILNGGISGIFRAIHSIFLCIPLKMKCHSTEKHSKFSTCSNNPYLGLITQSFFF